MNKCIHIKTGNELIRYQPQDVNKMMSILEQVIPNAKRNKCSFTQALGYLLNYENLDIYWVCEGWWVETFFIITTNKPNTKRKIE